MKDLSPFDEAFLQRMSRSSAQEQFTAYVAVCNERDEWKARAESWRSASMRWRKIAMRSVPFTAAGWMVALALAIYMVQ